MSKSGVNISLLWANIEFMNEGVQDKEQQTQINREAAVNIAAVFSCSSATAKSAKIKGKPEYLVASQARNCKT